METPTENLQLRYAGFWIRFLATLIDGVILGAFGYILFGTAVTQVGANNSINVNFEGWRMIIPMTYTLISWIVFSATPGKWICGIKITNEDGSKLTPMRAIIRYIGYILSAVIFCIGYFMIAFDKKKQGLHDKIAKTIVIKR